MTTQRENSMEPLGTLSPDEERLLPAATMKVTSIQRGDGTYARLLPDVSLIDQMADRLNYLEMDEPNGYIQRDGTQWRVHRQKGTNKNTFGVMGRFDNFREALTCAIHAQTPKHESEWEPQ